MDFLSDPVGITDIAPLIVETANQVIVTDNGDGTVTLSSPQDTHTGASPNFANTIITAGGGVINTLDASFIGISGSDSTDAGANIRLYGENHVSQAYKILIRMDTSVAASFDTANGNFALGLNAVYGTNATNTLGLLVGVSPVDSVANLVQLFARDWSGVGTGTLFFRNEEDVLCGFNQSLLTSNTPTFTGLNFNTAIADILGASNTSVLKIAGGPSGATGCNIALYGQSAIAPDTYSSLLVRAAAVTTLMCDINNNAILGSTNKKLVNGKHCLAIDINTAPSTARVNSFIEYAANWNGDGTATPHFLNEEGHVIKLYRAANIVDADGTLADITTKFNALLADLEAFGLLAA